MLGTSVSDNKRMSDIA